MIQVVEATFCVAHATRAELHPEPVLGPWSFRSLIDRRRDPLIRVNYDAGSSSSPDYQPTNDFDAYGLQLGAFTQLIAIFVLGVLQWYT